jgi:F-type H+-transporting ATPase subunit gamma
MPTPRDIRKRIRAVVSTSQITKAMQMVAAARLRKAQQMVEQSRPYSEKMRLILEQISSASAEVDHPFFQQREVKTRILVVFTSDRGMCGSFNTNVTRQALRMLREPGGENIKLVLVGKKAEDVFRRQRWPILKVYKGLQGRMNLEIVRDLTDYLIDQFVSGQTDRVLLLYTRFKSMVSYKLGVADFLPIVPPKVERTSTRQYIFEPDPANIFGALMPAFALTIIQMALADSLASEHGTRMIAMSLATRNAEEMIDNLTLQYNKARQGAITKELLEVVSGSEALRG